jgi:hypothetical protein
LAEVAAQCSADTFVDNQTLVLRINISGKNRHLRQAAKRGTQLIQIFQSFQFIFKVPLSSFCAVLQNKSADKTAFFWVV